MEREIYNTSNAKGDYQNYFASASVGLGKDFSASVFNLTPMIYATYTYARSSKFSEDGALFTKEYSPLNHNVISGAAGLNASVGLGENFELGAHAFWEQKVLGSELKNEAKFKDYGGKFEQNYDLAKNVARLGVKAAYKNENLSLSLGLNSALNSDYSSIGGMASFEYKFASKNSAKANLVRNKRLVKSSLKSKSTSAKSYIKSTAQSSKMPKKVAKNQI